MARLWQSGFELNSSTDGVEWSSWQNTGANFLVQNTTVRSGGYALENLNSSGATDARYSFNTADADGPYYFRFYYNLVSSTNANNAILNIRNSANGVAARITLTTTDTLQLMNGDGTQIGSDSSALSHNRWYRIELLFDSSPAGGSEILRAYIDGVQFAGAANLTISNQANQLWLGCNCNSDGSTSGEWYFDDVAINDSTGSSQNGLPGDGKIIHAKPLSAGDSNAFAVQIGGTAGSANNFTRVQEVSPDDATTYNASAVLNQEDLFKCDDVAPTISAPDTINVVAVGLRFADLVSADASAGVKVEIEKITGGTKSQSANLSPNSTTFLTNGAAVMTYPLVTYNDPNGLGWNQGKLRSMQIGYLLDAVNLQSVAVSTIWASIDFTPFLVGTTTSTTSASTTSSSTSSTSSSISSTSVSSTSVSTSTSSTSVSMSITTMSTSSTSSSVSSTSTSSTSSSTSISSTSSSISSTSQSSTSLSSTSASTSISSTSSSFSSTSSSVSSTSRSTSSTSFSSTSSSSSTSTTTLPPRYLTYSYEDRASTTITQQFIKTGTWVCPANVSSVTVECWGAGGGGGGASGAAAAGGGGGGGGAYSKLNSLSVTAGTSYTVTVGALGAGGAITPTDGTTGGDSWFSTSGTVIARGGVGGTKGGGASAPGGAGGSAGSGIGDITTSGGTGGAGDNASDDGGGGGGTGGDKSSGGNGVAGSGSNAGGISGATIGGVGGNGATGAGGAGLPGTAIGGGGGGSGDGLGGVGGAGAGGMVVLTYTTVALPTTGNSVLNPFTIPLYSDVSVDDGDYFIEYGSDYMIREYKDRHQNNADAIIFTWKGRTTESTLTSPMLIQIYNVNSSTWETLAVANKQPADIDFQVKVTQLNNVSNYYDTSNIVTFRSYQQVI